MHPTTATVTVLLYRSKTLANGDHPIMLRVCKGGKRKYVTIGFGCPLELWNTKKGQPKNNHPNFLLLNSIIAQKIKQYRDVLLEDRNEGNDKSSSELVRSIESSTGNSNVVDFFDEVIKRFKSTHRLGNANIYTNTKNHLKTFTGCSDYSFSELDYAFLTKYENWMRAKNLQESTMSVHFRTLRSLFNLAIKENLVKEKYYPFNKFKVAKFKNEPNRRAITKDEIREIEKLKIKPETDTFYARQIFLFIYYGQGINFIDVAKLKWTHIQNDRIYYTRSKTGKKMNFIILDPLKEILNYWAPITGLDRSNYIFPILNKKIHITGTQILNRVHKKLTETNFSLKEIGTDAKILIPLSSYVARHTYATTMKRQGNSTSLISETMGHGSEYLTQIYLKSFENTVIDDAVRNSL